MFAKWSLKRKFIVVFGLFVLLTGGVLYVFVESIDEPIEFASQELRGNLYQRSVESLFRAVAMHGVLVGRFHTKISPPSLESIEAVAREADIAFSQMEKVNEEVGENLQFTELGLGSRKREHVALANLQQEWKSLKAGWQQLSEGDCRDKHVHLVSDLRTVISHLGDTSNLILDPDLDSYYLMDITLLALPQVQDRIQGVLTTFLSKVGQESVSSEDKVQAAVIVALMQESDLARLEGDFQTILNEDINFYGKLETIESKLQPVHEAFVTHYRKLIELMARVAAGQQVPVSEFTETGDKVLSGSFDYWSTSINELDQLLTARIASYHATKVKYTALCVLGLILAATLSWFFVRHLVEDLQKITERISHSSQLLAEASSETSDSATRLSESATQQASGLQETVASVDEISAMVRQNADSANKTLEVVWRNQSDSEGGQKSVDELMAAIGNIKTANESILGQIEQSNNELAEIVQIISEIADKTTVINDIVFQTKLLSFNASVEAARAGEHGKGFAVVAEEVGNLAAMSGAAAHEISEMLSRSTQKVKDIATKTKHRVAQLLEDGRNKIAEGEDRGRQSREALERITESARLVASMIDEVALASKEQDQGISEINRAMSMLDQTTQQNSTLAQRSSQQAESLSSEAQSLQGTVQDLIQFLDGVRELSSANPTPQSEPQRLDKVKQNRRNAA